ncbi:FDXHR family putative zinc-binding protein [Pseudonocardia sichuanensis]
MNAAAAPSPAPAPGRGPHPVGETRSDPRRGPRTGYSCARCGARWTGSDAAHCGGCHETFTSPAAFDVHRAAAGACRPPTRRVLGAAESSG